MYDIIKFQRLRKSRAAVFPGKLVLIKNNRQIKSPPVRTYNLLNDSDQALNVHISFDLLFNRKIRGVLVWVSSDGGLAMPDCCCVKIVEFYRTHNGLAKPQALQEFSLETISGHTTIVMLLIVSLQQHYRLLEVKAQQESLSGLHLVNMLSIFKRKRVRLRGTNVINATTTSNTS
uniref:Uncharacterized protein n=1 Tax=Glossina austeni TaxID=7395 RepID=A0A1A9ULR5_GLOAU